MNVKYSMLYRQSTEFSGEQLCRHNTAIQIFISYCTVETASLFPD
jgi:hypothetical protein